MRGPVEEAARLHGLPPSCCRHSITGLTACCRGVNAPTLAPRAQRAQDPLRGRRPLERFRAAPSSQKNRQTAKAHGHFFLKLPSAPSVLTGLPGRAGGRTAPQRVAGSAQRAAAAAKSVVPGLGCPARHLQGPAILPSGVPGPKPPARKLWKAVWVFVLEGLESELLSLCAEFQASSASIPTSWSRPGEEGAAGAAPALPGTLRKP